MRNTCKNLFLLLTMSLLNGYAMADQTSALPPPPGPYISSQPWLPHPDAGAGLQERAMPAMPLLSEPVPTTRLYSPSRVDDVPTMPVAPVQGGWRW